MIVTRLELSNDKLFATDKGLVIYNEITPVELQSFTATSNHKSVSLNWTTSTETNNYGFEIQRNFESTCWTTIGFKEGKGTTTEQQSYSFSDNNLQAGRYLYRLKQIDLDGSFGYSTILNVEINAPVIFSLTQNYPNPFNPVTKIKYRLPELSKVRLTVYDVLGREIKVLVDQEKPAGTYEIEFDGTNLPTGVYFYRIEAGKYSDTKKLMLLK